MPDQDIVLNLCPHPIVVVLPNGTGRTYLTSGTVARCAVRSEPAGSVDGIPVHATVFGEVYGLPDPRPGWYYIVSRVVAEACPERTDLLIPNESVRDDAGAIIGCRSFAILGHRATEGDHASP